MKVEQGQLTTNVVHPVIIGKTFVLSITAKNSYWIIDISASDHMTRNSSNLNFSKPSSQLVIYTVNGSTSLIIGKWSITLTESHLRYSSCCFIS